MPKDPATRDAAPAARVSREDDRAAWRARREARRAKQREQNVVRAARMHEARLAHETSRPPGLHSASVDAPESRTQPAIHVGCSGWYYWHWRDTFYPAGHPGSLWFDYYASQFRTVELNAPFYSWPTLATIKTWNRQIGRRRFTYTVKVNELITHTKRFVRTATLVKDFGLIADLLGPHFGCFLFQLPPSVHYAPAVLKRILSQLDPRHRNVVEFRLRRGGTKRFTGLSVT